MRKLMQPFDRGDNIVAEEGPLFRDIVEGMELPVYVCSSDLRIIYMSPALVAKNGRDATDEICHRALYGREEPCPWCARGEVRERNGRITKRIGTGEDVSWEMTTLLSDSETAGMTYVIFMRFAGEKEGMVKKSPTNCDSREDDLAERQEIEEMLKSLSRAVEQSASAIVITDREGTIEYVNRRFVQMTGFALEELIGHNVLRPGSQEHLPDIFSGSWETVVAGGEWRGEQQSMKRNGSSFWEAVTISPIKNAEDVTTHYLSVREDITERKKTERELKKSRAELVSQHEQLQNLFYQVENAKKEWESTMDCIADMVVLADSEHGIKRYNKAFHEFTGMAFKEILGRKWPELLASRGLCLPDSCVPGAELMHKPSGRWFVFNSYPFADSRINSVSGTVITLHDVTVEKRFTGELEKAYAELKATQAKVVQQEKMASIGQLAAGVAHEINNPMGFISSNLGTLGKYVERMADFINSQAMLIDGLADPDAAAELKSKRQSIKLDFIMEDGRELIRESLEGAERVRQIVQNLKSFSRLDEAESKHADINECITSTINIVWNELKYKAKLVKELGEIPLTKCLPQQLNQVFMNLLVNAAQAIEKQGEIAVRTWHEDGSIYALVADTGCGMAPAVVNRIFEPFFTTKEVGKGTGLGLSIAYDIVKKHNGEISVLSEPGKGSTFTVRVPVVDGK